MERSKLREAAIDLRERGSTYQEIQNTLKVVIPKGTLSYWCKSSPLSLECRKRLHTQQLKKLAQSRLLAVAVNKELRKNYLNQLQERNRYLANLLGDKDYAKIALTMLYWGEGAKKRKGSLLFGNSDPAMIKIFLQLLKTCYKIDMGKMRCTVQCRADQNIKRLESFWAMVTKIPRTQFYKAQIDPRTIGRKSEKTEYKGVCRIDYFSADIFNDLMAAIEVISQ